MRLSKPIIALILALGFVQCGSEEDAHFVTPENLVDYTDSIIPVDSSVTMPPDSVVMQEPVFVDSTPIPMVAPTNYHLVKSIVGDLKEQPCKSASPPSSICTALNSQKSLNQNQIGIIIAKTAFA